VQQAEDASLTATTWRVIAAAIVIAGGVVAPGLTAGSPAGS
jgi:pantothenate kinase type III